MKKVSLKSERIYIILYIIEGIGSLPELSFQTIWQKTLWSRQLNVFRQAFRSSISWQHGSTIKFLVLYRFIHSYNNCGFLDSMVFDDSVTVWESKLLLKKHWLPPRNVIITKKSDYFQEMWSLPRKVITSKKCDHYQEKWLLPRNVIITKTCDHFQEMWSLLRNVITSKKCDHY